jgi:hypothetical protein
MGAKGIVKGKNSEREVINLLQPVVDEVYTSFGWDPIKLQRNTLQYDSGGIDICGLDWIAPEVKNQKVMQLNAWWKQCEEQAKAYSTRTSKRTPVLFYRSNHVPWRVRMPGWVGEDAVGLPAVVDISFIDFVGWFKLRLRHELAREKQRTG